MLNKKSITAVSEPTITTIGNDVLLKGTDLLINEIQERLSAGETINNSKLTEMAERIYGGTRAEAAYTVRDAYDTLETAVNKLLLESKATKLMAMSAPDALADLRYLMSRLPRQSDRTFEQVQWQQFSCPPTLAYIAARLLNPSPADLVLEPSAGSGSMAIWPRAIGARVICNEINPRRRALLRDVLGFETHQVDAEFIDDVLDPKIKPTAVLMNPPFSATGGRVMYNSTIYGANHVSSALRRLEDGGRLVAIVGEAMSFSRVAMTDWWRRIASQYNVRANLNINGREYGKYGTTAGIQIVIIDKTGPTPGNVWTRQLSHIRWGDAESIEEAWELLKHLASRQADVEAAEQNDETRTQITTNDTTIITATGETGAGNANAETETTFEEGNRSEEDSQSSTPAVFVPYRPARLKGGRPHPAPIVESASMAAVLPPIITYRPQLPGEIVTEGKLSDIQLERVIYAGQRHEQRLPDGARAGYYIGDGTGVGKGRILAGVILDNFLC